MNKQKSSRLTVITNSKQEIKEEVLQSNITENNRYQTNPMYEKLLNFRNLQENQKKRFSVDDLFKLC